MNTNPNTYQLPPPTPPLSPLSATSSQHGKNTHPLPWPNTTIINQPRISYICGGSLLLWSWRGVIQFEKMSGEGEIEIERFSDEWRRKEKLRECARNENSICSLEFITQLPTLPLLLPHPMHAQTSSIQQQSGESCSIADYVRKWVRSHDGFIWEDHLWGNWVPIPCKQSHLLHSYSRLMCV